jgi:hypothetical protein
MKNKKMLWLILAIPACLLLIGCSFTGQNYRTSIENVDTLAEIHKGSHKINVATFNMSGASSGAIMCRAAGTVGTPSGVSFAQYIHDGLVQELKHANMYSAGAQSTLHGKVNNINLSTMIGAGGWKVDMTFDDGVHAPFRVVDTYKFSTNFVAEVACEQAANAIEPMVEQFLKKLYLSPGFRKALKD